MINYETCIMHGMHGSVLIEYLQCILECGIIIRKKLL